MLSTTSMTALGPTQPAIPCVPGSLFPGVKFITSVPWLRMSGAIPPAYSICMCTGTAVSLLCFSFVVIIKL
jgi:hypothetical protein